MEAPAGPRFNDSKRVIIDDLANYNESDIGVTRELNLRTRRRRNSSGLGFIRNLFVILLLVGIVFGSFYVSFIIGKKMLAPIKSMPETEINVQTPVVSPEEVLKQVKEEAALKNEKTKKPVSSFVLSSKTAPVVVEKKPVAVLSTTKKTTTLAAPKPKVTVASPSTAVYYKVQAGLFISKAQAESLASRLRSSGFPTFIKQVQNGWRVQAGAFEEVWRAEKVQKELKAKGFDSSIIRE